MNIKMKKTGALIIFLIAIIVLIFVVYPKLSGKVITASGRRCSDSDAGNYYTKGVVEFRPQLRSGYRTYEDYCMSDSQVTEYECDAANKVKSTKHRCSNDCEDGACIRSEIRRCDDLSEKVKAKIKDLKNQNLTVVVVEAREVSVGDYVVLGHKNYGGNILRLVEINSDEIIFKDAFGDAEIKAVLIDEDSATVTIMDKTYNITYAEDYVKLKWTSRELVEVFSNC